MKEGLIHEDLIYAISSKKDGNLSCTWGREEDVVNNRKRFVEHYGLSLDQCVMMDLEHGDRVAIVGEEDRGTTIKNCGDKGIVADALVTNTKGVYLFFLTADCLPVVLYEPHKRVLAAVHLSRMTTDVKLIQKTIQVMQEEFDIKPADLLVYGGPSISRDSYLLDYFEDKDVGWREFIQPKEGGGVYVDVVGYNRRQLLDMGVKEANIYISSIDTCTSPDYFSHYRSVKTGEEEGRFATVVGIK